MILTCTAVYRLEVGADLEGPSDAAIVQDREMEPFDPPTCEASNVLFTDDGKFIATLNEDGKILHAWLERGGRSETLANWIPLSVDRWEANVPSTAHGMSGMRLVCHVLEPRD